MGRDNVKVQTHQMVWLSTWGVFYDPVILLVYSLLSQDLLAQMKAFRETLFMAKLLA